MLSQTRRLPDSSRVQAQGLGRNQVQKAVWANKRVETALKSEYNEAVEKAKFQIKSAVWPFEGRAALFIFKINPPLGRTIQRAAIPGLAG